MEQRVVIDCFRDSSLHYAHDYALVVVDVVRATTSAITAVAMGRECYPAPALDSALRIAEKLRDPLLVGELAGEMPAGFDMNNSPAALALMRDVTRPMVLLSSSGSKLMHAASAWEFAYLGCFRNYLSLAKYLAGRHAKIALIGAASRGEFREEDQICCSWIAEELMKTGFKAQDAPTEGLVKQWRGAPPEAWIHGHSVQYLKRSGQLSDLNFILEHVNDLEANFILRGGRVVRLSRDRCRNQSLGNRDKREVVEGCPT